MIEAEYGTSEFMLTARAWAVAGIATSRPSGIAESES